jgi:transposase
MRHFGGVPLVLNIDNLKAAVLQADWFDPELNPKLAEFCRHYGIHVMPCRAATPQHKGKVERGVAYVRKNAIKGHQFGSLAHENLFLSQWEEKIADQRIHGTTRKQVAACFEQEGGCAGDTDRGSRGDPGDFASGLSAMIGVSSYQMIPAIR